MKPETTTFGPLPSDVLTIHEVWIDGAWRSTSDPSRNVPVICAATGSQIGSVPSAGESDVDAAVHAAVIAFKEGPWPRLRPSERADVLRRIAAEIDERAYDLARVEALDCGKPFVETYLNQKDCAAAFRYYADLADAFEKTGAESVVVPLVGDKDGRFQMRVVKQPVGPVALITPWNHPLLMSVWKVAPALAAGATVVLKPSSTASLTSLELGPICARAGVPPGAFNVISGPGALVGDRLAKATGITRISFTGSTDAGRAVQIAAAGAAQLRPVGLELGGKSPIVVFADAFGSDWDKVAEWVLFGFVFCNGQVCSATTRLLVESSAAPALESALKAQAERIKVGHPLDPEVRLGPVATSSQHAKVRRCIKEAKDDGARLVTGGGWPACVSGTEMAGGYFTEPTIFADVTPAMRLWGEEVFGPVLAITRFDSEAEALELSNRHEYGLAAAVITSDAARAERFVRGFEAGVIWVNCSQIIRIEGPWGGVKNTGYGREIGTFGFEDYLTVKQVLENKATDKAFGWYGSGPGSPHEEAAQAAATHDGSQKSKAAA